ncbi:hypothetical protein [Algibacter sp. Ld11]|uniref:hypothetical protein n=1 Tax=Algibacter sp. Ld11 TaxID=649150 RepID=UPI00386C8D01
MKKAVLILILTLSFACKNETKKEVESTIEKTETTVKNINDNIFKIEIEAKVTEDDKFDVFYVADDPNGSFSSKSMISKRVKGSKDYQRITFELPKDILPYKLRIDLGDNGSKNLSDISIKSFNLTLNDKKIEIDNATAKAFFVPNVYMVKKDLGYGRRVIDGKYDPFLVSTALLNQKIELEL